MEATRKPVGDLLESVARQPKIKRSAYQESGRYPIVDQSQADIAGYTDDESWIYRGELPVVIFGDHTRVLKFVDFPFCVGADGTQLLRPVAGNDIRYFYYALRNVDLTNYGYERHFKYLKEEEIPAPALSIQLRIAGILSAYDELIENSRRRIKILESMARALYREWFVHFRFPGYEKVKHVPSPLGEIPEGWAVKKLGDLITYNRRATKPGPHLEDRRYVPIDCLPPKSLALLEAKPIEEAQSSLQLFEKGDILFGAMRPYFHKVVVAPFPGVTRTTCFVFKPMRPEWHAFATMIAFNEATVAYANAHSQGATIPYAVWDGSLSEMPVVLPPIEVLQCFETVVAPMLARLAQSFFAIGNLRLTRDLLLPRLLSGQVNLEEN